MKRSILLILLIMSSLFIAVKESLDVESNMYISVEKIRADCDSSSITSFDSLYPDVSPGGTYDIWFTFYLVLVLVFCAMNWSSLCYKSLKRLQFTVTLRMLLMTSSLYISVKESFDVDSNNYISGVKIEGSDFVTDHPLFSNGEMCHLWFPSYVVLMLMFCALDWSIMFYTSLMYVQRFSTLRIQSIGKRIFNDVEWCYTVFLLVSSTSSTSMRQNIPFDEIVGLTYTLIAVSEMVYIEVTSVLPSFVLALKTFLRNCRAIFGIALRVRLPIFRLPFLIRSFTTMLRRLTSCLPVDVGSFFPSHHDISQWVILYMLSKVGTVSILAVLPSVILVLAAVGILSFHTTEEVTGRAIALQNETDPRFGTARTRTTLKSLGIESTDPSKSALIAAIQLLAAVPQFTDIMIQSNSTLGQAYVTLVQQLNDSERESATIEEFMRELAEAKVFMTDWTTRFPSIDISWTLELLLQGMHRFLEEPIRSKFNSLFRHEFVDSCEMCPEKRILLYVYRGDWSEFSYEVRTFTCTSLYCTSEVKRKVAVIPTLSIVTEFYKHGKTLSREDFPECSRSVKVLFNEKKNRTTVQLLGYGAVYHFANKTAKVIPFVKENWDEEVASCSLEDVVVYTAHALEPSLNSLEKEEEEVAVRVLGENEEKFITSHGLRLVRFHNYKGICTLISTYSCLLQLPQKTMETLIRRSHPFPADCSLNQSLGSIITHWKNYGVDYDSVCPMPLQVIAAALGTGAIEVNRGQYGSSCRNVVEQLFIHAVHPDIMKYFVSVKEFRRGEDILSEILNDRPISLILLNDVTVDFAMKETDGFPGLRALSIESEDHAVALLFPEGTDECLLIDNDEVNVVQLDVQKSKLMGQSLNMLKCAFLIGVHGDLRRNPGKPVSQNPPKAELKKSVEAWHIVIDQSSNSNLNGEPREHIDKDVDPLPFFLTWDVISENCSRADSKTADLITDPNSPMNVSLGNVFYDHGNNSDDQDKPSSSMNSDYDHSSSLSITSLSDAGSSNSGHSHDEAQSDSSSDTDSSTENNGSAAETTNDEDIRMRFICGRKLTVYFMKCIFIDVMKLEQDEDAPPAILDKLHSRSFNCNGFVPGRFYQKLVTNMMLTNDGLVINLSGFTTPLLISAVERTNITCSHSPMDLQDAEDWDLDQTTSFLKEILGRLTCDRCPDDDDLFDSLKVAHTIIGLRKIKNTMTYNERYKCVKFSRGTATFRNEGAVPLEIKPHSFIRFFDSPVLPPAATTVLRMKMVIDPESTFFDRRMTEIKYSDNTSEFICAFFV